MPPAEDVSTPAGIRPPADRVLYRAATVVVGSELEPLEDGGVLVEGDRIAWVGPARNAPDGAVTQDLGKLTIVAGLIDAHVHLHRDGAVGSGTDQAMREVVRHGHAHRSIGRSSDWDPASDVDMALQAASNAERYLSAGVTTVRDLGGPGRVTGDVRDAIAAGRLSGARILTANRVVTITGGHGHQMGIECDDAVSIRRAVRQLVKDGSDWIKVMASGGFASAEGAAPYFPLFSLSEMQVLVEEAHRYGVRVAAHCQHRDAIATALHGGVDTIEHCTFAQLPHAVVDENLADEIAAAERYVVPTVNNYWLTAGVPWAPRDIALSNLRRLYDLGIKLVAGTDMGIPTTTPELYARGLEVFGEIGLPGREILASATTYAAEAIGLGDEVGTLTAGYSADLVALDGDPLLDVSAYSRPRLVVARGRMHVPTGAVLQ